MAHINRSELANKYPDSVIIWISLTKYIIIDKEFEYLKRYSWHIDSKGYVRRSQNIKNNKYAFGKAKWIKGIKHLHHEILPKKAGVVVDHINGNVLDNRKCNLRYATPQQNSQNRKPTKDRKYKGVHKTKSGKYTAVFRQKYMGTFTTEQEAARIYNQEALRVYGEFARLNKI